MPFLISRRMNDPGCYAIKASLGKRLNDFREEMNASIKKNDAEHLIELITISRPNAYREYAPYVFVDNKETFKSLTLQLINSPIEVDKN